MIAERQSVLLPAVAFGALLLFTASASAAKTRTPIAVIVHEEVPVSDLSLQELRRVFRGERQLWSKELPITLLMPPRGSQERGVLLDKIYEQRSEAQYQHYWINKLFDDGPQIAPKITGSGEMSASLVRVIPGAIALVPVNKIPEGVKVLRIGGKRPGEAGYPLTTSG